MNVTKSFFGLLVVVLTVATITPAWADPLPGEILKFQQLPMVATPIGDPPVIYYGHDEPSTAYRDVAIPTKYSGNFMADDFADRFDTSVVHVRWWGSYMMQQSNLVNKFLISFESDVPVGTEAFSHPGTPLLSQIVTKGALSPASGTFTETLIRGPDLLLGESLYQYNAELSLPFDQAADTVYWLKIVALDDLNEQRQPTIWWGWHNRDYTIFDPLASIPPAVIPGEHLDATLPSGEPIWHFQDDAVSGGLLVTLGGALGVDVSQDGYLPHNYVHPYDGPDEISNYSKDLAFELYTVPEPGTIVMLLGACFIGIIVYLRRR